MSEVAGTRSGASNGAWRPWRSRPSSASPATPSSNSWARGVPPGCPPPPRGPRERHLDQAVQQLGVADTRLRPEAGVHRDGREAGNRVDLVDQEPPPRRATGALFLEEEVDPRHRLAPTRFE